MNFLIGCRIKKEVVYSHYMQFFARLTKNKYSKKKDVIQKDYLDRLGSEQIKKIIDRGMKMPVISI